MPVRGSLAAVSAEGFALMGDVHLWTGRLATEDYTVRTPDGRPATREFAGERLARVVCADREMLSEAAISEIAGALAEAQARRVAGAISRVRSRHPRLELAVVTGLGDFIAADAARRVGIECRPARPTDWGTPRGPPRPPRSPGCLPKPCLAAANDRSDPRWDSGGQAGRRTDLDSRCPRVGLRRDRPSWLGVGVWWWCRAAGPSPTRSGNSTNAHGLSDDAAHWMAILAMDQYAHVLAQRIERAVLVEEPGGIGPAVGAGRPAVLAPYRWMRSADVLPHSWEATSDSVAAFIAGALDADAPRAGEAAGRSG